jgi:Family of unknown function (DUF6318)
VIRRLALLFVALTCCLALASCGGGGGDDENAAKSKDGVPPYARTNDEKGAQNFARFWIDTFNEATTSGETKELRSLNKPSCETCADFAETIDDIYAAGGHIETDGMRVKKILNEANIPAPGAGVSVVLTASPQKVYRTKTAKPQVFKQSDVRLRLILVRVDDHWEMDRIDPA